ncbi:transcriptional regulator [Bradyrhizobium sp.]|uniref:transcriptional regulator n=1 Tax=Bradyrhizobium sp. TaxID=376 RepID=UPI0025B7FC05|nr:transcriptional regulator [Bradyrhizobium sp.]
MNDEPKSPAELKEIRLNRKIAQEAEGIKAMADIAAADIAIRKRTADLRAQRLAREAADRDKPPEPKVKAKAKPKKKTTQKKTT